jgi:hypothetical protein
MLCSDIEASDVAHYQEVRTREGAAAGTINLEVSTLRARLRNRFSGRLPPKITTATDGGTGASVVRV